MQHVIACMLAELIRSGAMLKAHARLSCVSWLCVLLRACVFSLIHSYEFYLLTLYFIVNVLFFSS